MQEGILAAVMSAVPIIGLALIAFFAFSPIIVHIIAMTVSLYDLPYRNRKVIRYSRYWLLDR